MTGGIRYDILTPFRPSIHQMARDGQLSDLRCEMPSCYCPKGRKHFAFKTNPMHRWAYQPGVDSPILKMHGGQLSPDNVRLAHVLCNSRDTAWRKRVGEMLADPMSVREIALELRREGGAALRQGQLDREDGALGIRFLATPDPGS